MKFWHIFLTIMLTTFCANSTNAAAHHSTHTSKKKHSRHHAANATASSKSPRKRSTDPSGLQVPYQITSREQLEYVLNRVIASTDVNGANVAVFIKSLKSGETLYVRNIYQPLMPASIMKILTAEAALLYLGPEYRFQTQLLTDATGARNGILQGNLYIVLSGDPSLVYPDLEELMTNLQSQGITGIAGNVYIDNTAYDQHFYGPGWVVKDKSYCYGAPISASIINHNCPPVSVRVTRVGGHKKRIVTSNFYFAGIANGVVTDIPEYNRSLFKGLLSKLGVTVYGNVTFGAAPRSLSLIAVHNSEPLTTLIKHMLKKSDNVIAGALFKKLGQLYTKRQGTWENGSLAVSQILSKWAGVRTDGMRLMDGSGLSVDNLATPAQFMQVLQFAYHNRETSDYFFEALPISGVDGTLKNRLSNIPRKIHAKTGTLAGTGVASLAGYATTANKEDLAFVIMINGNKGLTWSYKGLEDKIATAMTRYND